jgi:hypothetical protein
MHDCLDCGRPCGCVDGDIDLDDCWHDCAEAFDDEDLEEGDDPDADEEEEDEEEEDEEED